MLDIKTLIHKIYAQINGLKSFVFDLIFPRYCLGCRKEIASEEKSFICQSCFGKIFLNPSVQCHICGLRNDEGACRNCRSKTSLKALLSAGIYDDPILGEMIRGFKYESLESLKKPLAELMIRHLEKTGFSLRFSGAILVPVPLTIRRKSFRGFNQSELLAEEISFALNFPVSNMLKRKKFRKPQAEISNWPERKENIAGAFELAKDFSPQFQNPPPEKIILIDDVSTSGATLEEAAKTLKWLGIKEIYGLVIAKG